MTFDPDPRGEQYPDAYPPERDIPDAGAQAEAERRAPEQPLEPPEGASAWQRRDEPALSGRRMAAPNDQPVGPAGSGGSAAYPPEPPYPQAYPPYLERRRSSTPTWVKLLGGCLATFVLLVALLICTAGGLAFGFFGAFGWYSEPASVTTTQTFQVTSAPTVRITSQAGNIEVVQGDAATVTVEATKHARARPQADAENVLRQINVGVTQSGNVLNVQVSMPVAAGFRFLIGDRQVDLTVTVPAQANLEVSLNVGDVEVRDVTGTVTVENDAGNLTLDDVSLVGISSLSDHAGNIDIVGMLQAGASLEARTNAGNVTVTLPTATSMHLDARTHAGSIEVDSAWPISVSRDFVSATASGDLRPNPSGRLTLMTDAGNITLIAR